MNKLLQDLNVGDQFYPASKEGESTPIFEVVEEITKNRFLCKNLRNGKFIKSNKALKVIPYNYEKRRQNS